MENRAIEAEARKLHKGIWLKRSDIGISNLCTPLHMIEPENAAKLLGLNISYYEELGSFLHQGVRYETAGIVDRQSCGIAVSKKFPLETIRFTASHEIGHWLLHPNERMHRDRPLNGFTNSASTRSPQEREADYFAACFLMPSKLVQTVVEEIFLTRLPFEFNDEAAFWLCPEDPDSILRPNRPLDRALALASAESYRGRHFYSLAKQFRVSATTMALRLKELKLICE